MITYCFSDGYTYRNNSGMDCAYLDRVSVSNDRNNLEDEMFTGAVTDSLSWFVGLVTRAFVMVLVLASFLIGGEIAAGRVRLSDLGVNGARRAIAGVLERVCPATRRHALENAMTVTESPFETANWK